MSLNLLHHISPFICQRWRGYPLSCMYYHRSCYLFSSNGKDTGNAQQLSSLTDIFYVTRIDDNGHSFKIKSFDTEQEAQQFVKWMERTKHKQTYIIQNVPNDPNKSPSSNKSK